MSPARPSRPAFKELIVRESEPPAFGGPWPQATEAFAAPPGGAAFVVDRELRYLVAEGEALGAAGFRPEDFIGKTVFEALDPATATHHTLRYRQALEGTPFSVEHDSHGRSYLSRGVPLRDAEARINGVLVVSYDVTPTRQVAALERRAEELVAALIENAPFGVYIVDGNFRMRALNKGAEAVFGALDPIIGRDFAEVLTSIWPAAVAKAALERFRHTLATGDAYQTPTLTAASERGAETQPSDWSIQRVTLPDGSWGVVCYFYDLTPLREAEALRARVAKRDAFLVGFSDALAPLTDARAITRTAAELLGREVRAGQVAYSLVDRAGETSTVDDEWSDGTIPSLARKHRVRDYDARLLSELRSGHPVIVPDVQNDPRTGASLATFDSISVAAFIAVPLVKDGHLVAVLAVHERAPRVWHAEEVELAQEVAARTWSAVERTRAEAELVETEARLQQALEAANMGTFVWHVQENRSEPDDRLLTLFGLPSGATLQLGEALAALIHPDDRAVYTQALRNALDARGSGTLVLDVCVLQPEGGERWLTLRARTTFSDAPRRPLRVAGVAADISNRKRIEQALRASEERLRADDRRKDEFLAVLAHELRNPLAPLRTGLEVMRLAGDSPATLSGVRDMMLRQVEQLVRLVDDLLDISRITSGKIRLQRTPSQLTRLLGTAIEAHRAAIDAAHVTLDLQLPTKDVTLDVDPARFIQIVSNVLHNAVKFTDEGGRIQVVASMAADVLPGAPDLVLTITDTGAGIPPELLPRVFDLFFTQSEGSARARTGGLGIGLALARRLIQMHGGTIEAFSAGAGRGSTFVIRLPILEQVTPISPEPRTGHGDLKRRIVVIDDNVDAADLMGLLVETVGGQARVAYDGLTGVEQVLAFRPDVVLLDIGMPDIDGYETCRRIRDAIGSSVIIVALTGWGQERDKERALESGFDAHLTKPVDPSVLGGVLAGLGTPGAKSV